MRPSTGDIAALEAQLEENRKQQDLSGADFEKLQDLMAEQAALEQQLEEDRALDVPDRAGREDRPAGIKTFSDENSRRSWQNDQKRRGFLYQFYVLHI